MRARIAGAAERAGRNPANIKLVAVSKTFSADLVEQAIEAGLDDLGENRIQEAIPKIQTVTDWCRAIERAPPTWHLVGHLQRNKVKAVLDHFAILQSLDSLRLAEALNERAARPLPVYLEVNVSAEPQKFGFAPAQVNGALAAIARLHHLRPVGLMIVAAQAEDDVVRRAFRELRELRDANGLKELSMGMTGDFEIAIEEGSTCVRVGRAIFGERPT